jgi:hypothetical protein
MTLVPMFMMSNRQRLRLVSIFKVLLVVAFVGFLPVSAGAQQVAQAQGFVTCTGPDCDFCDFVTMGETILGWLITLAVIISTIILAVAGLRMVMARGNPGALNQAKESLLNIIIGIFIVAIAFTLVDTLVKLLVGGSFGPWNEVSSGMCGGSRDAGEAEFGLTLSEIKVEGLPEDELQMMLIEQAAMMAAGPSSGVGGSNCGVDESSLVRIPGEGNHRATGLVVGRYIGMRSIAAQNGITLSITSSYRSDATQAKIWDGCPVCQKEGTVARPCSRGGNGSRHSSGVALDISSSGGRAGRCQVVNLCRSAGASFIMLYSRSNHVHCDWGGYKGEVNVSC